MKGIKKIVFVGATVMLSLPSCNGILGNIYDTPDPGTNDGFGFITASDGKKAGKIYIDCTSYAHWTYIDFASMKTTAVEITEGAAEPEDWDIAVHRYDAKTNSCAVLETGSTGFDVLLSEGRIPEGDYVEDIWTEDRIAVDMSGMMEGKIEYSPSFYNTELSKWLNVDTGTMPPVYTKSNRVYIIRLSEGGHAAVRLADYMDSSGTKGFMTIEYIYPFNPENTQQKKDI